eukprot:4159958-Amphidinium_carterae.1
MRCRQQVSQAWRYASISISACPNGTGALAIFDVVPWRPPRCCFLMVQRCQIAIETKQITCPWNLVHSDLVLWLTWKSAEQHEDCKVDFSQIQNLRFFLEMRDP